MNLKVKHIIYIADLILFVSGEFTTALGLNTQPVVCLAYVTIIDSPSGGYPKYL